MASTLAPVYVDDYHHAHHTSRSGALIRNPPPVIEEPVIEHEHHHLHHHIDHHIDHGSVGSAPGRSSRPRNLGREYSYDDLDVRERRYVNGTTVSQIHHSHTHDTSRRHRHRHRRRRGEVEHEQTRYTRSEIDLSEGRGMRDRDHVHESNYTVVDVAPGTKRLMVNVQTGSSRGDYERERERERDSERVDWRREHGVRRSRGLGNELWTEITKDLITREALDDMGYRYEETDFFYYVFEYLDREELEDLIELTEDIRRDRVRDLEYESISGASASPRVMPTNSPRMLPSREYVDDSRTEIIIEGSRTGRSYRRGRYFH